MAEIIIIQCFPSFAEGRGHRKLHVGKLYRALARIHRVTLLTVADFAVQFEEIDYSARLREMRFPKDQIWRNAQQTLRQMGVEGVLDGLAFSVAAASPDWGLRRLANELVQSSDVVIHETPYSAPLFSADCATPEIYSAHDFAPEHLFDLVRGHGTTVALAQLVRLERDLVTRARHVFAATGDDLQKFHLFYGVPHNRLSLGLNGYESLAWPVASQRATAPTPAHEQRARLLFMAPNTEWSREAAEFLFQLAPALGEFDFVLAGAVCEAVPEAAPRNIILMPHPAKAKIAELIQSCLIYINPVDAPAQSGLYLLDALSCGIPLLTTPNAAHRLGLTHGINCDAVPRQEFSEAVRRLARDPAYRANLADRGLEAAHAKFMWNKLTDDFARVILAAPAATGEAVPICLALNDYDALASDTGGKVRIRALLTNCGQDVVLLSFGPRFCAELISSKLLHITVPKTKLHKDFEAALNAGQPVSINDIVASLFARENYLLADLVAHFMPRVRLVMFEHPYMAPMLDIISASHPELPIVYSAHNVEETLKRQTLAEHSLYPALIEHVVALEKMLLERACLVICCTMPDAAVFKPMAARTIIVPNGCAMVMPDDEIEQISSLTRRTAPRAGFLGSEHPPNVAAAAFIILHLAPSLPDVIFEFVGGVGKFLPQPVSQNVIVHGTVSDDRKAEILKSWTIGLNPVLAGGGSNLKLPDYFAHGLAIVSTPTGARGFAVAENNCGLVVELPQFAAALRQLLANKSETLLMRQNARRYAAQALDWSVVTREYKSVLDQIARSGAAD